MINDFEVKVIINAVFQCFNMVSSSIKMNALIDRYVPAYVSITLHTRNRKYKQFVDHKFTQVIKVHIISNCYLNFA